MSELFCSVQTGAKKAFTVIIITIITFCVSVPFFSSQNTGSSLCFSLSLTSLPLSLPPFLLPSASLSQPPPLSFSPPSLFLSSPLSLPLPLYLSPSLCIRSDRLPVRNAFQELANGIGSDDHVF